MATNALTLDLAADIIASRIHDNTTATKTIIKTELNDKAKMIYSKRPDWEWVEGTGQFSTQANVFEYDLDNTATGIGVSDLRRFMGNLRIEDNHQEIEPVTLEEYQGRFIDQDNETALPRVYVTWNDKIIFGPAPDTAYVIDYRYYKQFTTLGDANAPLWPEDYNWIWLVGVEGQMMDYNDDERAARKWGSFLGGIKEMVGDTETLDENIRCEPFSGKNMLPLERHFPPDRFS